MWSAHQPARHQPTTLHRTLLTLSIFSTNKYAVKIDKRVGHGLY